MEGEEEKVRFLHVVDILQDETILGAESFCLIDSDFMCSLLVAMGF